ncbi:ABC transporter permease [Stackebrandtia nassauensis]|uniref:Transport permease protein n=1 Tax=Stackebrandtia nassauensis (strain DSM 44728 / CIP 108903 / NRRL B-16338 / NBRC 102104 / LLR-40K-21) TaxID=446470 RepID=D3QAX1_STANL|nr:ABC transporter permease [Stackebrandtia nassauensis]ADD44767.1 ABC-2 type transporter [Stackebrandtia nassauensis DSM 44728]
MRGFASLSKALFKGFVRDKVSVFFTIVFPLMFLVIFGALFSDSGSSSSTIIQVGKVEALDGMKQADPDAYEKLFDVTKSNDQDAAIAAVEQGDADAVVRQDGEDVYVYYSAADQTRAAIVQASISGVVDAGNLHKLTAAAPDVPVDAVKPEKVEDESLTTIQYLTPGLLGWAISISGVFGAAATLVDWRKNKILRRLRLAPVPIPSVIGARVGVSMVTSIVQMGIFVAVASIPFFGLQLTGYWWMAIPVLLVGTLAFLSIGMVVGAIAKTAEGASGLGNLIVMPMAFASGSFFPLDQSPVWLQTIAKISPLTYINEGLLSVMVRGNGPASVLAPMGMLLAFTVVFAALAWKLFKWDDL